MLSETLLPPQVPAARESVKSRPFSKSPPVSDAMGLIHEHATDIGPGCELVDVLVVGRVDATGVTFPLIVQDTLYEIQGLIESVPFVESDDRSDLFSREGELFAHAFLFDHDEAGPFGRFEVNPREL